MEHYIAARSMKPLEKNDIIAISAMAKKDRAMGNRVVDGSIGTFLDDDRTLGKVETIDKALSEHVTDCLGYPSVYGDPEYVEAVEDWVFEDKKEKIKNDFHVFTGATIGGTGALSIAFNLFLEPLEAVLLPDVMWTNYILIAKKASDSFVTYNMFNEEGGLDIDSIKEKIETQFAKGERVLLVINDPCQNPTGYCMSEEEYDNLFEMLNEEGKKGKLTVLFDIAYLSYYDVKGSKCKLIDKLSEGKTTFLPLIVFSCSKVFGLYGLRMGALIALALDEEEKDEIHNSFGAQARGVYSVPVGSSQHAVAKALKDKNVRQKLVDEIEHNKKVLGERGKALLEELEDAGIEHYPYGSGFFVTIKVKNAFDVFEKLKKEHIYIVPMNEHSMRIALSGMTKEDGVILVEALKRIL